MLLYKYYSRDSGLMALLNRTVLFSRPKSFNDPFELAAGLIPDSNDAGNEKLYEVVQSIDSKSRILCLTRSPENLLMWSHYASSYSGLVLGYDSKKAKFADADKCIIPANFGSIIYKKTKPNSQYPNSYDAVVLKCELEKFSFDYLEALQRFYLHKGQEWSYEEEVRVVRHIDSFDFSKTAEKSQKDEGVLERVPPCCVKSIIFGWKFFKNENISQCQVKDLVKLYSHATFYEIGFDKESYKLCCDEIPREDLLDRFLSERFYMAGWEC